MQMEAWKQDLWQQWAPTFRLPFKDEGFDPPLMSESSVMWNDGISACRENHFY